jgi:undecaprenyl diphosphate synthase
MKHETTVPAHIGIIMDGNGRWATARGLPRIFGHRAGAEAVRRVVEAACELGVRVLTLYAFSWENWDRPHEEIHELMGLLDEFIKGEARTLHANQIRLRAIGRIDQLPAGTLGNLHRLVGETADYDRMTLVLALSYGGRQEIVDAVRRLVALAQHGGLQPEQVDEALISRLLYTAQLPDPDLIIRTSGEQRISNFLLWQASYAEFYVTPKLWPEFSKVDLLAAIHEYERRERRFGRTTKAPRGAPSRVAAVRG